MTDHPKVNSLALLDKPSQQGLIAYRIQQPRNALAVMMDPPQRRSGEARCPISPGDMDPVLHVLNDLVTAQRRQMKPNSDALAKLAQAVLVQVLEAQQDQVVIPEAPD